MGLVAYPFLQASASVALKATWTIVFSILFNLAANLVILSTAPHKMAIIEELGLQVNVNVNGIAAAEYPDEKPDDKYEPGSKTTKVCHHYVESVDNAEFAIHFELIAGINTGQLWISRSQNNALCFSVALDGGRDVTATWVTERSGPREVKGIYGPGNTTFRKFCFAAVSTGQF